MSKININLASGTVLEKPLVTCFKGNLGNYLVLDNETNGQMGYPIICISKFNGTSAEKIVDPNEWNAVKENLKTIIAGTALPYLTVPETISANDEFFTQLTLPVASFDLLKNAYAPEVPNKDIVPPAPEMVQLNPAPEMPSASVAPAPNVISSTPEMATPPVDTVAPVIAPMPEMPAAPVMDSPVVPPVMPMAQDIPATEPVIAAPIIDNGSPVQPVVDAPVQMPEAPSPIIGSPEVSPAVPEQPIQSQGSDDIAAIKESFMKSCETMFDALIKKFENK